MSFKPVIFLAFANDKVDQAQYLRNLSAEMHGIRSGLDETVNSVQHLTTSTTSPIDPVIHTPPGP